MGPRILHAYVAEAIDQDKNISLSYQWIGPECSISFSLVQLRFYYFRLLNLGTTTKPHGEVGDAGNLGSELPSAQLEGFEKSSPNHEITSKLL